MLRWALVLGAFCLAFACPPASYASPDVILGFLSQYAAPDGASCVHHGADVRAAPLESWSSPVEGTVRFAGRTPGPHGGSVLVVSVDAACGIVTMMPFDTLSVNEGEAVSLGQPIGSIAEKGDPSSAATHVHLGLRRNGEYVDPGVLLSAAAAPQATPASEVGPATEHPDATGPVVVPLAEEARVPVPVAHAAVVRGAAVGRPEMKPATAGGDLAQLPTNVSGPERGSAGESVARPRAADGRPAVPDVPAANRKPAASGPPARQARQAPIGHVPGLAYALAAAAALWLPGLLGAKAFQSRIASGGVSDRLGRLLQHLKAGDTLCGLTSCPGPTAFTVPGPLAQRR